MLHAFVLLTLAVFFSASELVPLHKPASIRVFPQLLEAVPFPNLFMR